MHVIFEFDYLESTFWHSDIQKVALYVTAIIILSKWSRHIANHTIYEFSEFTCSGSNGITKCRTECKFCGVKHDGQKCHELYSLQFHAIICLTAIRPRLLTFCSISTLLSIFLCFGTGSLREWIDWVR